MIDFIISEFKKITINAIKRFAKKNGFDEKETQLRFRLDGSGDVFYTVCHKYQKVENVSFLKVLDVLIDLRGYSAIAPPFIKKSLLRYAEKYGCDPIIVMFFVSLNGEKDITIWVYNSSGAVEKITLQDLFSEIPSE